MTLHQSEIDAGNRFKFGRNWKNFSRVIDEKSIEKAIYSLSQMLETSDLRGKSFIDVGCGSGLFSLAARLMGASVVSFDFDPDSVSCTVKLKSQYLPDDTNWVVEEGSVLDEIYLSKLGKFDIVYSWGVLHHTGSMWVALGNVDRLVEVNGKLFIALYNQQFFFSNYWRWVKSNYNKHVCTRPLFILVYALYPTLPRILLRKWRNEELKRGMSIWYDLLDWLGGYPFEVSTPQEIFEFYKKRDYELRKIVTVGGKLGCNEFVFQKKNYGASGSS